jgi:integrase
MGPQFPQWDVAYCAFVISINTTAGPGEIRYLRLQDIDLEKRIMRVQPEGAKNLHRIRPIPLSDSALEAVRYLWARAQKLGSKEPAHYLLPYRVRTRNYDQAVQGLENRSRRADEGLRHTSVALLLPPSRHHEAAGESGGERRRSRSSGWAYFSPNEEKVFPHSDGGAESGR